MAFTAKMAFSLPKYRRLFAQKKAYQGGSRAPQDPPSYAQEKKTSGYKPPSSLYWNEFDFLRRFETLKSGQIQNVFCQHCYIACFETLFSVRL